MNERAFSRKALAAVLEKLKHLVLFGLSNDHRMS